MLTLTNLSEQNNWDSHFKRYARYKNKNPEFDQLIVDLAKDGVSPKHIKESVSCKSGYVDAVLWRVRRRNLL